MASQVMRITLKAYDHELVDSQAKKIIETVKKNGSQVSGPVPLPTKKEVVTILRATHKYKDSREQFEQRTHKRLIDIAAPTQKTVDDRIPRMLAFIEKNYEQDLRLEDMAEEFNFNYHYLSAYFHQHMKEGFSDYLNEIRTAKACELLENTDLSIAQISEKVGYSEHSYFCRVFKKVTGKTPSVYRRKNHG